MELAKPTPVALLLYLAAALLLGLLALGFEPGWLSEEAAHGRL